MNKHAEMLLSNLISQYDETYETKKDSAFPFSRNIGDDYGIIYIRKMAVTNFFCLSNLEFSEEVRGQGVLTAFIDYIKANPCNYQGVSVELIHNPRLAKHVLGLGFVLKPCDPISDVSAPTLIFPFDS